MEVEHCHDKITKFIKCERANSPEFFSIIHIETMAEGINHMFGHLLCVLPQRLLNALLNPLLNAFLNTQFYALLDAQLNSFLNPLLKAFPCTDFFDCWHLNFCLQYLLCL